jgi:hypothetical protein
MEIGIMSEKKKIRETKGGVGMVYQLDGRKKRRYKYFAWL